MNYRHSFHAGNFADVHKHVALLMLLRLLKQKDKPFLYLDTHSGRGSYDLQSGRAQQTLEHEQGVARIMNWAQAPDEVKALADAVRACNQSSGSDMRYYPGSPLLAMQELRPVDRGLCYEAHADEAKILARVLSGAPRMSVEHGDGWQALRSKLPPLERRALVLIDPPYESAQDDFSAIKKALLEAHARFATGVYALWYPITSADETERLHRLMKLSGIKRVDVCELCVRAPVANTGLNGSGMLLINAPYTFTDHMQRVQQALCKRLGQTPAASARVVAISGE